MFVWIKKSQKKRWFKQRRNLRRKIKYQISCCIRGPFSLPPNMPGKRVTLLGGKNIHELQLQRKEIKAPLRVKQTRNKAEQNGPIIEPLWKMRRQFLCFDWLATLRCGNILYVAKRTSQVPLLNGAGQLRCLAIWYTKYLPLFTSVRLWCEYV